MAKDHHSGDFACDYHSDDAASDDYSYESISDHLEDADNEELDGENCQRPTMACVVAYRERALATFCAISLHGARSAYGRSVIPHVLVHIAVLAAPYIICDKIFRADYVDNFLAHDVVLRYQSAFRNSGWWWHMLTDEIEMDDLRVKGMACNGMLVGGIAMPYYPDNARNAHHISVVSDRDVHHVPTWITFVLQRRGCGFYNTDLMIRTDKTLRQVLQFVTSHKNLRSDESTCLTFWGMCQEGSPDLDSMSGGVFLHSRHTSPLLDKSMGEMWQLMQTHQQLMLDNWTSDDHDDVRNAHDEQDVIRAGIICLYDYPPSRSAKSE